MTGVRRVCRVLVSAAVLTALAAGCSAGWTLLSKPAQNQVLRVTSGDTILFRLEEDAAAGYRWDCACDDPDVVVVIEHDAPGDDAFGTNARGVARVTVHVHRGYDGPSTLRYFLKRPSDRRPVQQFTHTLYRRTGDVAIWE